MTEMEVNILAPCGPQCTACIIMSSAGSFWYFAGVAAVHGLQHATRCVDTGNACSQEQLCCLWLAANCWLRPISCRRAWTAAGSIQSLVTIMMQAPLKLGSQDWHRPSSLLDTQRRRKPHRSWQGQGLACISHGSEPSDAPVPHLPGWPHRRRPLTTALCRELRAAAGGHAEGGRARRAGSPAEGRGRGQGPRAAADR